MGAGLALAAIALTVAAAASADVTAGAVREVWARSNPLAFAASFTVMTLGLVFLAARWRAMMPVRDHVGLLPLTALFTIGTLLNYALPGPVGEFASAALAGRRFRMPAETAFAAAAHARFIGLGVAGLLSGSLLLVTDLPVPPDLDRWVGVAVAAISGAAIGLAALSARPELLRAIGRATVGRFRALARLQASIERFADALGTVGRLGPLRYLVGAGWALCGHATIIGGIYIAANGLGAAPDFTGLAFTYAVATAGAVVLFAFPGSQVGWDAMFATLLVHTAGLALPDALAVTLLVRSQQLFTVLLGGVALLQVAAGPDDSGASIG